MNLVSFYGFTIATLCLKENKFNFSLLDHLGWYITEMEERSAKNNAVTFIFILL